MGRNIYYSNEPTVGDHCPMMIVRVWNSDGVVNGQVFLDGCDTFWATSRSPGDGPMTWHWIEKA